jgi:hypothetical protein
VYGTSLNSEAVMDVFAKANALLEAQQFTWAFEVMADEIERLRAALQAIADDPDTTIEAAVYAKNALRGVEWIASGRE